MPDNQSLPFINTEDLRLIVEKVLRTAQAASDEAEERFYANVVDPFSAIFDSFQQGITLGDWMKQERSRHMQKTLQNALGNFHQDVLGTLHGWEVLPLGSVVDVRNTSKKIIAEVKNKFNTTKGSDKKSIYDNLLSQINGQYAGYTAYYVEVIPPTTTLYNKAFTPSDNITHERRPTNENIRVIDGKSFYALATDDPDALKKLYQVLPTIIGDILQKPSSDIMDDDLFNRLFNLAYQE
ncbi:MAG TPA: Eco47II family restriction endonuclease [Patescibacteria group bacterium]